MIDLGWIRQLIELMRESEVDTIEISRFGTRVRISKSPAIHMFGAADVAVAANPLSTSGALSAASGEAPALDAEEASQPVPESTLSDVTSPMVGTFYRAPAPDAPPYVEVGDTVAKGQTLCILEAMKLMNELESEVSGTIREICVENAEPVEYGQLLFRIEPRGAS